MRRARTPDRLIQWFDRASRFKIVTAQPVDHRALVVVAQGDDQWLCGAERVTAKHDVVRLPHEVHELQVQFVGCGSHPDTDIRDPSGHRKCNLQMATHLWAMDVMLADSLGSKQLLK